MLECRRHPRELDANSRCGGNEDEQVITGVQRKAAAIVVAEDGAGHVHASSHDVIKGVIVVVGGERIKHVLGQPALHIAAWPGSGVDYNRALYRTRPYLQDSVARGRPSRRLVCVAPATRFSICWEFPSL